MGRKEEQRKGIIEKRGKRRETEGEGEGEREGEKGREREGGKGKGERKENTLSINCKNLGFSRVRR